MFEAVSKNKIKTFGIVTLITVFLYFVFYYIAYALGASSSSAITIAGVVSIASSFGSYWYSDTMVIKMSGAKPATGKDKVTLENIVSGLSVASGLPMPKLYVVEDMSPNAFATGRNHKHAAICVTRGLLTEMDYYQLEGVLAHEMAHIKNYDILLQTIASVMIGMAILLSNMFSRMWFWGGQRRRDDDNNSGANVIMVFIGLIFVILAPIAGELLKMALSRNREYLADATAAEMTRNPEGLASALEKLGGVRVPVARANNATEGLYIVNPLKALDARSAKALFSTHPPIEKRVEALRNIR